MASDAADAEKKIRALKKKLGQIEKLKEKGGDLDKDAKEKVASEPALRQEVAALEAQLRSEPDAPAPAPAAARAAAPVAAAVPAAAGAPAAARAPAAAAIPAVVPEPEPAAPTGPSLDQEKRLRALRKKIVQIEQLKEKGGDLDPDAQAKVASEPELRAEVAALERGQAFVPSAPVAGASPAAAPAPAAMEDTVREDPHAAARAEALEPPVGDIGLLLDDETEKRFKTLQKKLRDIGKLREKDKLDKLQVAKLAEEPGLIESIAAIQTKAAAVLATRRQQRVAAPVQRKDAAPVRKLGDQGTQRAWECPNCDAFGSPEDLMGGITCPKCGYGEIIHFAPGRQVEEEVDEEDDSAAGTAKARSYESNDLKTARQKKAAPASGAKNRGENQVDKASAKWPEVREALESGDNGVDKARQKKAIAVNRPKAEPPYDVFDSTLLKCGFLTRIELKLAPGVLGHQDFHTYFPGALAEGLVDMILKENSLATIPAGIRDLQRIRSIDISHNMIEVLPGADTWEHIAGSLELLDLSFNRLTTIAELAPLTKLSALKVDANRLTSLDGVSWGELKQLVTLSAAGNLLEELPDEVSQTAGSIEYLELSENRIQSVTAAVCDLKKLKCLSLDGNPIKDPKVTKALEKGVKDVKVYLSKSAGKRK